MHPRGDGDGDMDHDRDAYGSDGGGKPSADNSPVDGRVGGKLAGQDDRRRSSRTCVINSRQVADDRALALALYASEQAAERT